MVNKVYVNAGAILPVSTSEAICNSPPRFNFKPFHTNSPIQLQYPPNKYTSSKMSKFEKALELIDQAHSEDPRLVTPRPAATADDNNSIPYELHYANKMTKYLHTRHPHASETLQLAIRAQHLRRWEVPRDSYPKTKPGYYAWRAYLQKRQAELAQQMCVESGYAVPEAERVAALVRKEGLRREDEETQVLEDVACLVFLDDRLEEFGQGVEEGKMVEILRKTLAKMSGVGRELAGEVVGGLSEAARGLVQKAMEEGV